MSISAKATFQFLPSSHFSYNKNDTSSPLLTFPSAEILHHQTTLSGITTKFLRFWCLLFLHSHRLHWRHFFHFYFFHFFQYFLSSILHSTFYYFPSFFSPPKKNWTHFKGWLQRTDLEEEWTFEHIDRHVYPIPFPWSAS